MLLQMLNSLKEVSRISGIFASALALTRFARLDPVLTWHLHVKSAHPKRIGT
jgi:hypothetical protein